MTLTPNIISDCEVIDDPVLKCIKKFESHPSVRVIKGTYDDSHSITFEIVTIED